MIVQRSVVATDHRPPSFLGTTCNADAYGFFDGPVTLCSIIITNSTFTCLSRSGARRHSGLLLTGGILVLSSCHVPHCAVVYLFPKRADRLGATIPSLINSRFIRRLSSSSILRDSRSRIPSMTVGLSCRGVVCLAGPRATHSSSKIPCQR